MNILVINSGSATLKLDVLEPSPADDQTRRIALRLSAETASAAQGARAGCVFVNDQADRACLETLTALGGKLIALRCAGYNNVDAGSEVELSLRTGDPRISPR